MSQNNISRLESPDYGKHTLSSLKRIAEAMDVALVVRFVPFSQYIDWLSGTPHIDGGLSPEALAVESFDEEEQGGKSEHAQQYWSVSMRAPIVGPSTTIDRPEIRKALPEKLPLQKSTKSEALPLISTAGETEYGPIRRIS